MRVAFATTMAGVPWAGSEELWADAAACLCQRGFDVQANCAWFPSLPPKLQRLGSLGCQIERRRRPPRPLRLVKRFLGVDERSARCRWLDRTRADLVVISQSCQDGVEWGNACRLRGIPYCFITQVVAEYFWPQDAAAELAANVMQEAQGCYFVSQSNLDLTQRQLGIELTNAKVVWNPFTVPYAPNLGWPERSPLRLACVGRLDPRHKGQDLILDALSQSPWRSRDVRLSLFGVGECETTLRRLSTTYGLRNVTFHGQTSDIAKVWRTHHALVLASRVEGMPLAAIEAMVCSRPCVLTDVGGNAELVRDGETGFIARSPSCSEFADALERLWSERDRLESMGQKAREWIESHVPQNPGSAFADELETSLRGDDRHHVNSASTLEPARSTDGVAG